MSPLHLENTVTKETVTVTVVCQGGSREIALHTGINTLKLEWQHQLNVSYRIILPLNFRNVSNSGNLSEPHTEMRGFALRPRRSFVMTNSCCNELLYVVHCTFCYS